MAADQRRRRLNSSTIVGCSFREHREQYRAKKKKLGFPQDDTNGRSNISLEWDDKNKSVVAKREQIGILQRDLAPFIDSVPHSYSSLADILSVPREIFELENLVDVLSYEVWQTRISETERKVLTQFLPKGAEPEKTVQELLSGDNFHFGNPFLKWGAALCAGEFHPDDLLQLEQHITANKKAYFSELQKYHNDMIEELRMWKDRWDGCKDPEEEILQKIWRPGSQAAKSMQFSETRFHDPEENNVATPESCSWATSEKACSNENNQDLPWDTQGRKGFSDSNLNNSSDGLKGIAKPKKVEKLQKRNIQFGDGAKYMSYIKVSKEQHQRVKRTMKHTSNSIQPRSLNNVLGNLETLHVQPFEVFEEEERQKLHDYWLQLVNKDIPVGYRSWITNKLKVQQVAKSLGQELEEKLKFQEKDGERDNYDNLELIDDIGATISPNSSAEELLYGEDEKREVSQSFLEDQKANQVIKAESSIQLEDEEDKETDNLPQQTLDVTENVEEEGESVSISAEEDREENIASISSAHQVKDMTVDSHDNSMLAKVDDLPLMVSEYPGNMNHIDIPVSHRDPRDSADDVWSAVSEPGSFYHSAAFGHQYVSSSELSLSHPQIMEEQPTNIINLEADAEEKDSERELLHREADELSFYGSFPSQEQILLQEKSDGKQMMHGQPHGVSFFGAYPTQNRNELFESFFRGHDGSLPNYHPDQKRMALDFQQPDNLAMENGQISANFRDQVNLSLPLEMRQKRVNDLYVDHNMQDSVYPDGGRYSIQKHLPVHVQDWNVSTVRMLAPSPSHLSSAGGFVSQNWFPGENRARGGWSSLEGAVASSRSIGSQSNSDQSLFSVLSECNELHASGPASAPYDSVGTTDRFMQPGTYNALGGGIPSTSNILGQTADPLNYFGGHEASAGRKANNLGWIGVSHQNPGLQDSMSKPFVRSWNQ
ncbi:uncharacterized protein LOC113753191 isoform X1 [Coffea eugenioides]|uniref:uncharacterized protein LOC113753191 isoform X1 n=1 Tax=Coffea eugenioides TaxID=49369 RepID=UPI000F60B9DC|nr:uncharacterized protein LOC113753191 isoform X1 [Coffea eugenioides]